ncbi:MAG: queuosine salvage family protein [Syntrophobacteraceae bacterium]|nr:queuosine salvage family protein [Syntrophobacteraceae bacterium]
MNYLPVLSSVERVVAKSRSVTFHPDQVRAAIAQWGHIIPASMPWEHSCHFFDGSEKTVRWIFTLDVLNHSFWPDPGNPVWSVIYKDNIFSGYWGLAAALKRAQERGVPVADPGFLASLDQTALSEILSLHGPGHNASPSREDIPMIDKRLQNLQEAGSILLSELHGDITTLFHAASGSAAKLATLVASLFPSFRDEAAYGGGKVYFLKRAQIFASDVFAAFGGKQWGDFKDMDRLTAFADYKLPQVLRELGIISYQPELAARVLALAPLEAGSTEEVEIRAMTVWAVERLKEEFQRRGRTLTSPEIDSWLWGLGQMDEFRKTPYHRCRTIFY